MTDLNQAAESIMRMLGCPGDWYSVIPPSAMRSDSFGSILSEALK